MIFPRPKKLTCDRYFSFDREIRVSVCDALLNDKNIPVTVFGETSAEGNLRIICEKITCCKPGSPEAYCIEIKENDGIVTCTAAASCDAGFIRAFFAIKRMLLKNEFAVGEICDSPSFAVRGYIEGFYGKPWKSDERLEMLELMALFGENTHYYAPKDDPWHRNKWRECYPEKEAAALKRLVDKAKSLYVKFTYCIAPGLSMRYTSEEDFFCLCEKTRQLYNMGISSFGLLLDDIPADLFYDEDKREYGTAIAAHVELVNKYYAFIKSLSADCSLTVCPTAYHGKGNEDEVTGFAAHVPADVLVFFTGSDICSKEITLEEAEVFERANLHKPLYWDNYPVNDAEMFMEMHIGPVIGRAPDLYKGSAGLISNCMEYFDCNKLPLITIAAYLWNSEGYDPEESFIEAVNFLIPEKEREAFIFLCDQFRTSCLKDENSKIMGEYLSLASVKFQTGDFKGAVETVEEYALKVRAAVDVFRSTDAKIYRELSRWIKKFILMSDILDLSLEYLKGADKKEELEALMSDYNESATVLTGFCFREYIESVLYND